MKSASLLLLVAVFWPCAVYSQTIGPEVISTAGKTFQTSEFQVEWTLGESLTATLQNSDHQITQGFHQPVYLVSSIDELPADLGQINVFPNPVSDQLNLSLSFDRDRKIQVELFDAQAKLLWNERFRGEQFTERHSTSDLPAGIYYLHVIIDETPYSKIFKIQKLN
jgi:Secretion system C-terminal sorting domain